MKRPSAETIAAEKGLTSDNCFPRGSDLPKQSPLFWVAEKDRYLRQLLIRDIQSLTKRTLLVYFATFDARSQISQDDDAFFVELLRDAKGGPVDLMIETPGGYTDAAEKVASVLTGLAPDLRVIVPSRAKSNGTMLALTGSEILMGPSSELGPADPLLTLGPNQVVPANFLINSPTPVDPILAQIAHHAILQTSKLAATLLQGGMMKGQDSGAIERVVRALSSRDHYPSHGSVIDAQEAKALGLTVRAYSADDPLWQRFWLLRCMYAHDAHRSGALKIFEGPYVSNSVRAGPV